MGFVGAALLNLATWLFTGQPVTFTVFPSVEGYAQPLPELVESAQAEDASLSITFAPESLKEIYVCEYSQTVSPTARGMFFNYVERYQACLNIVQQGENKFIIRPSQSPDLKESNGDWLCKCSG
jgi:hypothetical protein